MIGLGFVAANAQVSTNTHNGHAAEVEALRTELNQLKTSFEEFKKESTKVREDLSTASTTIIAVGSIVAYSGEINKIPANWKLCDGQAVSAEDYPVLWERIGTVWGGSDEKSFNLPDLRGRFLRGLDGGTKRDPDFDQRTANGKNEKSGVGSSQEDAIQIHRHGDAGHVHGASVNGSAYHQIFGCAQAPNACGALTDIGSLAAAPVTVAAGKADITDPTTSGSSPVRLASETRVKNVYVYWIIRVR
jgi:microcystin-dependent protein